jgi:2-haloacid dehalogenase
MVQPIKALGFDVFGTVVNWRDSVAREAAAFFKTHGRPDIDPYRFADDWRARYQPAMEACRSGKRPYVRLNVLHRENLELVLDSVNFDRASAGEEALSHFNDAWQRLDPWPDTVAGLRRLKTRFIIAPISNGNISLMIHMAKRAGLPWDAILGAETSGAYKPAPDAYTKTADILGLAPAELCLVAAHNGDLRAARSCGLSTAFVLRPLEHGKDQRINLSAEDPWDYTATSFEDLATQLGC